MIHNNTLPAGGNYRYSIIQILEGYDKVISLRIKGQVICTTA